MYGLGRSGLLSAVVAVIGGAAALSACGGGGGGSGSASSSSSGVSGGSTTFVKGQYGAQSSYTALCVAPRSGTDAVTGKAYPDRQGTALDEKYWLRSWNNDYYLWYSEVMDQDPATFASDVTYFAALKTTATTPSGAAKDKFHFTYATTTWESLSQSGVQSGYGVTFSIIDSAPPRKIMIAYTEPGAAATIAPDNLARGAEILAIDGVDAVNAGDQASVDTLNAGLAPATVGETHTFTVMDARATTSRSVTLVSADVTETPVQNVKTFASPVGTTVGYMLFNDHIATAESELVSAFNQLKSAGVQDLVLDIRYNGGGYLDIASEVAYMVAGPTPTAGQTFELTRFNNKYPTTNPITGDGIAATPFHTTTQGFSASSGAALPTLNLTRVFILTTSETCSASESIINSLQGVNVQVIQVGSTTCGKPYGFYPQDNCGVTYFSIQFQGVNAKGFGDYPDGFTPANTATTQGVSTSGCSVADDYSHSLGDAAEGMLSAALNYQATGACGVPPSGLLPVSPTVAANGVAVHGGKLVKSVWRQNRIYGRPAAH